MLGGYFFATQATVIWSYEVSTSLKMQSSHVATSIQYIWVTLKLHCIENSTLLNTDVLVTWHCTNVSLNLLLSFNSHSSYNGTLFITSSSSFIWAI